MYLLSLSKKLLIGLGKPFVVASKFLFTYRGLTIGLILISGMLMWFYLTTISNLPNVNEIYNPPRLSTKILDRNGEILYKFYEDEDRSWISLSKIPKSLVWATLSIEDKDYYRHHGISIKGIFQATYYNLFKKETENKLRGGSTITQQLVKSVFFSNEKTFSRKIKEAIMAIQIETKLSKDEILERYFNQVAYGGETYGISEAAKKYFDKNVEDITLSEAAFLAGLPAAPSSYSPTGSNPELGIVRQKHVIEEMRVAGYIDEAQSIKLKEEKLNITSSKVRITAPHFVFFVKEYLENKYGYENFGRRGLVIRTSLDKKTQLMAESIVEDEVKKVQRLKISNGSALVVNPNNGEILAMVGSVDYFSKKIDGKYNITTALRQPGSSIKPINYLLALINGWSLASTISDERVVYKIEGQKLPYMPQNYNGKYMGKVTLRTALASSLNIPSVKLLAENGVSKMIDLAEKMGINSWTERSRFGLALALGGGEVKMIELANAYSVFATLGKKTEINPILQIDNYLGEQIYKVDPNPQEIISPKYAYLINNALSDDMARAPIFGLNSKLKIPGKTVAVKTGTTNSLKDNWCIGWTPTVLVAAWVGNNDNSPMSWVASGVSGATPIWNRIMNEMLKNKMDEPWMVPDGVYKSAMCGKDELFVDGNESKIKCFTPTPIMAR